MAPRQATRQQNEFSNAASIERQGLLPNTNPVIGQGLQLVNPCYTVSLLNVQLSVLQCIWLNCDGARCCKARHFFNL